MKQAVLATAAPLNIAIVGGGWAGISAAVESVRLGHRVVLYEMAPQLGGRARTLPAGAPGQAPALDNGQHILVGAYTATLALMRRLDPAADTKLMRLPLTLVDPSGQGLRLGHGSPIAAFARMVLAMDTWPLRERLGLLAAAGTWATRRFRCRPDRSVAALTAGLSRRARHELIEPLCVAALNTPADQASAGVFLRVLQDALFAGPGSSDLLLPRVPLGALVPDPARRWLGAHGAVLHLGRRVARIRRHDRGWVVDETLHDRVILACSSVEAARLAAPVSPVWSQQVGTLQHEPIVTVYVGCDGASLIAPMTTLPIDAPLREPAQFAFDHGATHGMPGRFAFVVSGARPWVERGLPALQEAVRAQARAALRPVHATAAIEVMRTIVEKRATFRCTPGLSRPPMDVAPGLLAAGDYVAGPYPATLEGAVRHGLAAARVAARHLI